MFGWSRMGRWGFYAASALIGGTLVVALLAHALAWSPTDGRIASLDIKAEPRAEGALRVTERVAMRFTASDRSPSVQRVLGKYDSVHRQRVDVGDLSVVDGAGKPLHARTEDLLSDLRLRFDLPGGERDQVRSYTLSYTLRGVAQTRGDQTIVERDFAPGGFGMPVDRAAVRVVGAVVGTGSCLTGPPDARRFCRTTSIGGPIVRYGDARLGPEDGLAVSTRFEPPFLEVPKPTEQDPPQAYGSRALQIAAVVALGLLLIGGFATWHRGRRPRTWRKVTGIPIGIRPADAGALYRGSAEPTHLSASLLDLVRRGFIEMSEDGVLRQRMVEGQRDELSLHEWSLMLKLFGQSAEVRMDDVRSRAPEWSWEILREIERQILENRWRVSRSTTILQRAGWLGVMLLGGLAYLGYALLSVVAWPELPLTDLFTGAGVALGFAAGCAFLLSRVEEGALTVRGRITYAEVAAFADHVNRRGVDDDDPAMGIWAVGLGVRPDPYAFAVVPPSERSETAPTDRERDDDDDYLDSPADLGDVIDPDDDGDAGTDDEDLGDTGDKGAPLAPLKAKVGRLRKRFGRRKEKDDQEDEKQGKHREATGRERLEAVRKQDAPPPLFPDEPPDLMSSPSAEAGAAGPARTGGPASTGMPGTDSIDADPTGVTGAIGPDDAKGAQSAMGAGGAKGEDDAGGAGDSGVAGAGDQGDQGETGQRPASGSGDDHEDRGDVTDEPRAKAPAEATTEIRPVRIFDDDDEDDGLG